MTKNSSIQHRDICILGGGAAGVYFATRLQDLGLSTFLIEKSDRLGGHSYTYRPENSDQGFDMGVRIYPDIPIVRDFYNRFDIQLEHVDLTYGERMYINSQTGKTDRYKEPNPLRIWFGLLRYERLIRRKFSLIEKPGIHLPNPVPEDLLMPFGELLQKHRLGHGFIPITHYLQGLGAVRDIPALYAMKNLPPSVTKFARTNSFLMPTNGTSALYDKAAEQMHDDLLMNATVQSIKREETRSIVEVETPLGTTQIECEKIIVTYPQLLENMQVFDLDERETALFSKFKSHHYWTTLVKATGLPKDVVFFPIDGENPLVGQTIPGIYAIVPTPYEDIWNVLYGAFDDLSDDEVKAEIVRFVENISISDQKVKVESFELFIDHHPFGLHVELADIRNGFYRDLDQLQGHRNTFYGGAALDTNGSHLIWHHSEALIREKIMSSLSSHERSLLRHGVLEKH